MIKITTTQILVKSDMSRTAISPIFCTGRPSSRGTVKRELRNSVIIILVPRSEAELINFGQHQESRPLARSNDIPVLNGIVNTIDHVRPEPIRFARLDSEHTQSDGKSVNRGFPVLHLARGTSQRSRFLVLTKRSGASGDENALL